MGASVNPEITRWTRTNAVLLLSGSSLAVLLDRPYLLFSAGLASFIGLFVMNRSEWQDLSWGIGPANLVTAFRLFLLLLILAFAPANQPWTLLIALLIVASLDGLDGFVARKTHSTSTIGEYFDKETDAFYVLAVGHILYELGYAPLWILGLGWIRYLYVLASMRWKPSTQKETRFPWGPIIAVVIMIGLPLSMVIPEPWRIYLYYLLSGLLLFSFGRSFIALLRTT
ncbi:MAG: CDP-alcohol phosphatidyltransferase family protein [Bacteroidota bacterium]